MSQENVEIVRQLLRTLGEGDFETAAGYLDPDAEWHNTAVFPGPRTVAGADAIAEFWRDLFGTLQSEAGDGAIEAEDVVDSGETVVVRAHGWGHGQQSGVPVDMRWAHVIRFRGPKVVRVDTYGHFASALEAAGLSE
jgi:ketosteroid isomerase-like protein